VSLIFINNNLKLQRDIDFLSDNNLELGSLVYLTNISSGTYSANIQYNSSGVINNQLINISTYNNLTGTSKIYYCDFSDDKIIDDYYKVLITGTSSTINSFNSISGTTFSSGTVNFYSYELANYNNFPDFIITEKINNNDVTFYKGIKKGEINFNNLEWNNMKDYSDSVSGLVPNTNYYLSKTLNGKITNQSFYKNYLVLKSYTKNKAYVDLSKKSIADSFIERKEQILQPNDTINFLDVFGSQSTAQYRFFDINNPVNNGKLFVINNNNLNFTLKLDTSSSGITLVKNTNFSLNIYVQSSLINFQNNTNDIVNLKIYKET